MATGAHDSVPDGSLVVPSTVVVRGGGDLATGVVWRLRRSGFAVVVTEVAKPLAVRRTVSFASAVECGQIEIEGMVGRLVSSHSQAAEVARSGVVAVLVSPELPAIDGVAAVVDARMAKRNIDTAIDDAPLVVALGPGFVASVDCHAVIETLRGARLGRVLWEGSAAPDTGTPGLVSGHDVDRVLRAPASGAVSWSVSIGERVAAGQAIGSVAETDVTAPFDGVVRGLILEQIEIDAGTKIGDLDARFDVNPHEISDKALAVGGGVVEAVVSAGPVVARA